MRTYWKTVAKLKARARKNPDTADEKLLNQYLAIARIRSRSRKLAALNDIEARMLMQWAAERGELTMEKYRTLIEMTLPDDARPRRFRKSV